jgi:choline dehydrogenase-like flavoprotein
MILDLRNFPPGDAFRTDICIVGSGPAGIAIAREFLGTKVGVLLLESGGLSYEPASERLNAGTSVGLPYTGSTQGRRRQFGGAANIWGAVCVELDRSDFRSRPWIPIDGWPLDASDLGPYHARARALFRVPAADRTAADWRSLGMETAAFDPDLLRYSVVPTSPATDLGNTVIDAFKTAPNIKVLLHATVTALRTNAAGTILDRVEIRSLGGGHATVKARAFVLCCGGIENARLLLLSRDTHAAGIGNGHDLVGRYFADHTFSSSARVQPPPGRSLRPLFRTIRRRRSNLRPRLSLTARSQAEGGVLNCMAQVLFKPPPDGGFAAALKLREAVRFRRVPPDAATHIVNVVTHPRELAMLGVDRYMRGLHPAAADAEPWIQCMAEQVPDAANRVTLGEGRDAFGLPLPVITWHAAELERRTIAYMTQTVAREFARLGLGEVHPQRWLTDDGADWRSELVEGYHHLHTTRMAATPRAGVVDPDCRVFDVAGLYVAGTSVFPAAGFANPTLTLVAVAIRLADHLKARLGAA